MLDIILLPLLAEAVQYEAYRRQLVEHSGDKDERNGRRDVFYRQFPGICTSFGRMRGSDQTGIRHEDG